MEKVAELLRSIHKIPGAGNTAPDLNLIRERSQACRLKLINYPSIDLKVLEDFFCLLERMYSNMDFKACPSTLLHNDLHYLNMIYNPEGKIYVLDWQQGSDGDYCADLAYFKIRTLDFIYDDDPKTAQHFFRDIIAACSDAEGADTIEARLRFYSALYYHELIWRSCIPNISDKWLSYFYNKMTGML